MSQEELQFYYRGLKADFDRKVRHAEELYIQAEARYGVGDVVSTCLGPCLIEAVRVSWVRGVPSLSYHATIVRSVQELQRGGGRGVVLSGEMITGLYCFER